MCNFISWIEYKGKILYLEDAVFSKKGKEKLADCGDNDLLGHGAIRSYFDLKGYQGTDREVLNFWDPEEQKKMPKEIVEKLKTTELFLKHWGRMFKKFFQIDDLAYILREAPDSYWFITAKLILEKRGIECEDTPVKILKQLVDVADDKDWRIRLAILKHPRVPVEILEQFADDKDYDVCRAVAKHPKASAEALKLLANDKDDLDIYKAVAEQIEKRDDITTEDLESFAKSNSRRICLVTTRHPKTSVKTLKLLANDKDDLDIYKAVAEQIEKRDDITVKDLKHFAKSNSRKIRRAVISHPKTSVKILERLANDYKYYDVCKAAQERLNKK